MLHLLPCSPRGVGEGGGSAGSFEQSATKKRPPPPPLFPRAKSPRQRLDLPVTQEAQKKRQGSSQKLPRLETNTCTKSQRPAWGHAGDFQAANICPVIVQSLVRPGAQAFSLCLKRNELLTPPSHVFPLFLPKASPIIHLAFLPQGQLKMVSLNFPSEFLGVICSCPCPHLLLWLYTCRGQFLIHLPTSILCCT